MRLSRIQSFTAFALTCLISANAWADPQSEARALAEESLTILKANADRDAPPDDMAKCIFNLEKAAGILEAARDTDSDLAKEVNSQLYWARKRSTLAIDASLDKLRGTAGVSKPVAPKTTPAAVKTERNSPADEETARKAFLEAEKFAGSHGNDDYVVSLNWFQFAGSHPGTDYSLKALTLGREAQARFKIQNPSAKKEALPDTPEMKPFKEAEALALSKSYDKAVPLYKASLKISETAQAHRKLGQAYFAQAQVIWESLMKRRPELAQNLNTALANAFVTARIRGVDRKVRNPNDPTLVAAQKKCADFDKECEVVFSTYDKARDEFKAVLRMAPENKDLIASGFVGLCLSRKTATLPTAKSHMVQFLKEYTPVNDDERGIYDYCKTELERLSH